MKSKEKILTAAQARKVGGTVICNLHSTSIYKSMYFNKVTIDLYFLT